MNRRQFLGAIPASVALLSQSSVASSQGKILISPFDYQGVNLRASRWRQQVEGAHDFYVGLSDDDILHGFREAAGLAAPGKPLGGWCRENSSTVFGQWLSGLARLYRATGDTQ